MFTDSDGKIWSNEENYLKYKLNVRRNLKASLAIENYANCNKLDDIYNDDAFTLLKEYRSNKLEMNEQELLEITFNIFKKFNLLFDKIGREKFIFYDDGDVNYIWDKI